MKTCKKPIKKNNPTGSVELMSWLYDSDSLSHYTTRIARKVELQNYCTQTFAFPTGVSYYYVDEDLIQVLTLDPSEATYIRYYAYKLEP